MKITGRILGSYKVAITVAEIGQAIKKTEQLHKMEPQAFLIDGYRCGRISELSSVKALILLAQEGRFSFMDRIHK